MQMKLAGILTYAAVGVICLTWLLRRLVGLPVMTDAKLLYWSLGAVVCYFIIGIGVANLGVTLIQEAIADRRTREDEIRRRLKKTISPQSDGEMTDNEGSGLSEGSNEA